MSVGFVILHGVCGEKWTRALALAPNNYASHQKNLMLNVSLCFTLEVFCSVCTSCTNHIVEALLKKVQETPQIIALLEPFLAKVHIYVTQTEDKTDRWIRCR